MPPPARSAAQGFDLLRFFIMVMTVLTTIVGGFGLMLFTRHRDQKAKLVAQVNRLQQMKKDAETDEELRGWILQDRKAKKDPKKVDEIKNFLVAVLNRRSLQLANFQPQQVRPIGGFNEASFRLQIDEIDMKQLVDYLYDCQNEWPGLKVKDIVATRNTKDDRIWKATITLTLFSPRRA